MGIATWLAAGLVASLLARLIRRGRTPLRRELAFALGAALLAGLAATALDFGGLDEPDPRAAAFAALTALASVGIVRAVRQTHAVE